MKNIRSRDAEIRNNEMLENYEMEYISPLTIPHSIKKEGHSYAWVRKEIRGKDDFRVEEMASKGWQPVPADRAPNFAFDPLDRNPLSKRFVTYKDLLLMERPSIYSERETANFNKLNSDKIKSLRGVTNDMGGFAQPIHSINSF